MMRRDFLKTASAVVATAALPDSQLLAEDQIVPGRVILPMNRNWRYHPAKVEGADSLSFDDGGFEHDRDPTYKCRTALA